MHIRNTYGKQSLATPWNQCLLLRFYHVQNCQLCSVQRQCTCPHPITSVFGGDLLLYPDDTQNFLTRAPLSLIAKWKIWILRFLMFDLLRCLFIFYCFPFHCFHCFSCHLYTKYLQITVSLSKLPQIQPPDLFPSLGILQMGVAETLSSNLDSLIIYSKTATSPQTHPDVRDYSQHACNFPVYR